MVSLASNQGRLARSVLGPKHINLYSLDSSEHGQIEKTAKAFEQASEEQHHSGGSPALADQGDEQWLLPTANDNDEMMTRLRKDLVATDSHSAATSVPPPPRPKSISFVDGDRERRKAENKKDQRRRILLLARRKNVWARGPLTGETEWEKEAITRNQYDILPPANLSTEHFGGVHPDDNDDTSQDDDNGQQQHHDNLREVEGLMIPQPSLLNRTMGFHSLQRLTALQKLPDCNDDDSFPSGSENSLQNWVRTIWRDSVASRLSSGSSSKRLRSPSPKKTETDVPETPAAISTEVIPDEESPLVSSLGSTSPESDNVGTEQKQLNGKQVLHPL